MTNPQMNVPPESALQEAKQGPRSYEISTLENRRASLKPMGPELARRRRALQLELLALQKAGRNGPPLVKVEQLKQDIDALGQTKSAAKVELEQIEALLAALVRDEEERKRRVKKQQEAQQRQAARQREKEEDAPRPAARFMRVAATAVVAGVAVSALSRLAAVPLGGAARLLRPKAHYAELTAWLKGMQQEPAPVLARPTFATGVGRGLGGLAAAFAAAASAPAPA